MNITYNGLDNPNNLLTFTDVPNILKVNEEVLGTKATFTFQFDGNLRSTVTADSQYYVTFLGETVSNVMEPSNATNKRFYISGDEDCTAYSFARALRNCSSLAADFDIVCNTPNSVRLTAKTIGKKWSGDANYIQRNIPSQYLTTTGVDGNAYSIYFNSKIAVDVYNSDYVDADSYVTTLEKNFYGNECAFDVSPVLATLSEYGKTKPYLFSLSVLRDDGESQYIGWQSGNTAIGYHANQSDKFKYTLGASILMNKERGTNGMVLYTYGSRIPYSVLCGSDTGGYTITLSCKDSTFNEFYTYSTTARRTSSNYIIDGWIDIPSYIYPTTYYVDLTIGSEVTRFNIIKPLKATEYYQRILWRNEYGGISFFDFTGAMSETDSVDVETYEKNVFDYYDTEEFEKKKIYSNEYNKTVKLTSHLIEKDGKWIFNSLMRSKKVWTEVNGKTYYIIPKSIEVTEDSQYNDIFTATLTYEFSDI